MELKQVFRHTCKRLLLLLIVPYGIETIMRFTQKDTLHSFNRTLWN